MSNQKSELEAPLLYCAMQNYSRWPSVTLIQVSCDFFFIMTQHLCINIGHRWLHKIPYCKAGAVRFFLFFFTLHTQQTVVGKTVMPPSFFFFYPSWKAESNHRSGERANYLACNCWIAAAFPSAAFTISTAGHNGAFKSRSSYLNTSLSGERLGVQGQIVSTITLTTEVA